MKKSVSIIVFALFLLAGCKKDDTTGSGSYTPSCTGTAKSYASDVAPLVNTYCGSCHANFTSYNNLKSNAGQVRSQVVSGNMPRGASLTTAQKDAIVCWIDAGAPNN